MSELRLGLAYDDVLLVPRRSSVASRRDVSTRARFTRGIEPAVGLRSGISYVGARTIEANTARGTWAAAHQSSCVRMEAWPIALPSRRLTIERVTAAPSPT
jgi:hypothetical protein